MSRLFLDSDMTTGYRGRFAPSPSGPLHFGSLVAAMGSYLDARSSGGVWLLRIEDLDPPRERKGAADDIIRTLEAFGFEWDEEILRQSRRTSAYQDAAAELSAAGHCFPCSCTRKRIADTALVGAEGPIYPGTCRNGMQEGRSARSIRVMTPNRSLGFQDRVCGEISQNLLKESGDFIIRRADGFFAYQLAVVVDDARQGITRVVRGVDLLMSTPKQVYLQSLLGLPTPEYAHLPLVLNRAGRKLSKQSRSRPVGRDNPLPSLIAAFEFLNQTPPDEKSYNIGEFWVWAINHWNLKKVPCRTPER